MTKNKYSIFNKVTFTKHLAPDLDKMFDCFKLVTVLSDIELKGSYEDDYYIIREI